MHVERIWYEIDSLDNLDTPFLALYPERMEKNLDLALAMVGNPERLRPHIKTHKCLEIIKLSQKKGIHNFKCATISEAEILGEAGVQTVVLAYQPLGPKQNRFVQLIQRFPKTQFSCLVDTIQTANELSRMAESLEIQISVYIDLNIGMNRTGILPNHLALELFLTCQVLPGINPIGIHAYDGHIHDADFTRRKIRVEESFKPVWELKRKLGAMGLNPQVLAGGSPTFPVHAQNPDVVCSPGTFIYWDWNYLHSFPEQGFLPSALVVCRVISLLDNNRFCLDLGHKSIGAENSLDKRVWFVNAPEIKILGQSEEHLMVQSAMPMSLKLGDSLYGMPYHICPTVALYEQSVTIVDHIQKEEWKHPARDRKIRI